MLFAAVSPGPWPAQLVARLEEHRWPEAGDMVGSHGAGWHLFLCHAGWAHVGALCGLKLKACLPSRDVMLESEDRLLWSWKATSLFPV